MSLISKSNQRKAAALTSIERGVEANKEKISALKREMASMKLQKEKLLKKNVYEQTLQQHITISHIHTEDFDEEEQYDIGVYEVTVPFSMKMTNGAASGGLIERDSLFSCLDDFKVERVLCTLDLIDEVDGIVEMVGDYVKDKEFLAEFSKDQMFDVGTYKPTTPSFGLFEGKINIYVYVNQHHDEKYIKSHNRGYDD